MCKNTNKFQKCEKKSNIKFKTTCCATKHQKSEINFKNFKRIAPIQLNYIIPQSTKKILTQKIKVQKKFK